MTSPSHPGAAPGEAATAPADNPAKIPAENRHLLDNRSAPCAVGLIKAARLMDTLPAGSELEIWSRDRFAPMEVPLWAQRDGYQVEQRPQAGRWPLKHFVFVIIKPG